MRDHATFLFWFGMLAAVIYVVYAKWLNAPAHSDPSIPIPYSSREGKALVLESPVAINKNIPPIDAQAPAKYETATFALG